MAFSWYRMVHTYRTKYRYFRISSQVGVRVI